MTRSGWVFLIICWGTILGLFLFALIDRYTRRQGTLGHY